ncbi:MAG: dTMP kinase [Nanoarchaeota archaeon]
MSGKLIVIEGIDGAGSETQSKLLLEFLRKQNIPAERVYYPDYGSPIGNFIHDYLHKKQDFSVEMQFLMYASDMVKDKEKINKWLEEGKTVICDRYFTSTLAYQCMHGFPINNALNFAEQFGIRKPDIIIFLDILPETSIERKKEEKKGDMDRNEENIELQLRISKEYKRLAEDNVLGKWFVVDGEKTKKEVFEEIKNILEF